MRLEKFRKKESYYRPWNPGEKFICPKCGFECGKKNSQLVNQGNQVSRWCGKCNYYEVNIANQIGRVNLSTTGYRCPEYP